MLVKKVLLFIYLCAMSIAIFFCLRARMFIPLFLISLGLIFLSTLCGKIEKHNTKIDIDNISKKEEKKGEFD